MDGCLALPIFSLKQIISVTALFILPNSIWVQARRDMTLLWYQPLCFSHSNARWLENNLIYTAKAVMSKTRSSPASLPFKGRVAEHTTLKYAKFGTRIRCKLMEIWKTKLANFHNEKHVRDNAMEVFFIRFGASATIDLNQRSVV